MNIDKLTSFKDDRGELLPIEFSQLPFVPQRIFTIKNVPQGTKRGQHGHYKCKQYYVCIKGVVLVRVCKNGSDETLFLRKGEALFVPEMVWTSEEFLTGTEVLLVLCSHAYDKNDYYTDRLTDKLL